MSASKIKLGLIGQSISLSLSPAIQEAFLDACGMEGSYELFDCPESDLIPVLERLLYGIPVTGFNVTVPYKVKVFDYLQSQGAYLSDEAKLAGAVNTVVVGLKSAGHNTDIYGLRASIEQFSLVSKPLLRAALIGTGGAARAAVIALNQLGISEIVVYGRTGEKAVTFCQALADQAEASGLSLPQLSPAALPQFELSDKSNLFNELQRQPVDIVVNATSIGHGSNDSAPDWLDALLAEMPEHLIVQDLVYAKGATATLFCAAADRYGLRNADGKAMLIHQASMAFKLWTGRMPPYQAGFDAFDQTLQKRQF
jgi:shikimate dehydrogenase